MIPVRKTPNLHLELYQRDVTGRMRAPWELPIGVMSKSFQEVIKMQRQVIQKMVSSKVQNMLMPDLEPTTDELERKRESMKSSTKFSADSAPQGQREGALRRPHSAERRDLAQFTSVRLQPACMTERESHQNTRREVTCDSDKRNKDFSQRNARIDCPAVLDDPKDHAMTAAMKALTGKVDTAQIITQWCWRPPTNRSGNESREDQKEIPNLTSNRDEEPEHPPRTKDHEAD